MSGRVILDTSFFIAVEQQRELRLDLVPEETAVSIVTLAELRQGVLQADDVDTRALRLETLSKMAAYDPFPIDGVVAANWSAIKVKLKAAGRSIGANDAWIAATAVAHQVPLVTQDEDFLKVPGLEVILV